MFLCRGYVIMYIAMATVCSACGRAWAFCWWPVSWQFTAWGNTYASVIPELYNLYNNTCCLSVCVCVCVCVCQSRFWAYAVVEREQTGRGGGLETDHVRTSRHDYGNNEQELRSYLSYNTWAVVCSAAAWSSWAASERVFFHSYKIMHAVYTNAVLIKLCSVQNHNGQKVLGELGNVTGRVFQKFVCLESWILM